MRVSIIKGHHVEEFQTITTYVKAILNSRYLTPLSEDINEIEALTPFIFKYVNKLIRFLNPKQCILMIPDYLCGKD